ncbi:MAG: SpaA isopeptide-forming pilin-related protein, partial [Clostridiales bacterium]|nr:SpaA isopeptide-forming pilin-related protein [Clostridiales bacterium]
MPGLPFGAIKAYAAHETFRSVSGGVSPYNIDTAWLHYRSDGATAYCRQKGLDNPDGTNGDYYINAWEPGEREKMLGLFGNVNSIAASYGISGDYKRALIQMCIWTITHDYESYNPSLGSVTSSDPAMLSALHALHSAAMGGYTATSASISGLSNGSRLVASAYGSYIRYGPFSVSGAKSAQASAKDAPAGSFFGNASAAAINKDNLTNGQNFYFYIPRGAGWTTVPSITVKAQYDTLEVTKYSGFSGYQDQITGGDPGSAEITRTGTLLGAGEAEIWKHDDEDSKAALSGAAFAIDEWSKASGGWKDSGVSVTWDNASRRYKTGVLVETDDNDGRFRIRETKAPYSYLSGWREEISVRNQYGAAFKIHATDTPVKLKISLFKLDRNTEKPVPQGDASLMGAVYGLFMNEDREHPNGTKYTKDQRIAEAVTDKDGKIVFEDLFPAKYYIKELKPSEGYLLDETIYEIDGVHDGVEKSIARNINVTEQVKKQKFELIKIGTSEAETEVSLLGAGFKVYLISELSGVKDGSLKAINGEWMWQDFKGYDFSGEPTAMIDGVHTPEFFSNELGHFISPEFPYGTYVVTESTTPEGYLAINPFIVKVTEDSREAQPWRIFDDKEMKYFIRVIKKDSETGNAVLNKSATYRIFDLDKNEYVQMKTTYPSVVWHGTEENPFKTDETGMLITPEKLTYGHYRLDEIAAPEGYVLAGNERTEAGGFNPDGKTEASPQDPIYIEFMNNTPVYLPDAKDDVLEVIQYNEQQKGKINIEKKGEQPDCVSTDIHGNLVFRYENEPLEGAVFEIIADGDIISQDGSGTVLYKDGDVVERITTNEEGHAWSDLLYIGNYILKEVEAPDGYLFVPDEYFVITPIDQKKQFTFMTWDLTDVRQRLDIEITKTDRDGGGKLKGAEFGLYSKEGILFGKGGPAAEEGDPDAEEGILSSFKKLFTGERFSSIEKDTLIATAKSGKDGKAIFTDLPPGEYYVIELRAPKGYNLNGSFMAEFTLAYEKGGAEALTWKATCKNSKTKDAVPSTPAPVQKAPAPAQKSSSPKTGDGFSPLPFLAIAIAAGIAAIILIRRIRKGGGI